MTNNTEVRYTIPFSPLEERIAKESPQLSDALAKLKIKMGEHDFNKYINSLVSLKRGEDRLLMITKREMYRSILMGRYIPAIKESFAVKFVRIVNQ